MGLIYHFDWCHITPYKNWDSFHTISILFPLKNLNNTEAIRHRAIIFIINDLAHGKLYLPTTCIVDFRVSSTNYHGIVESWPIKLIHNSDTFPNINMSETDVVEGFMDVDHEVLVDTDAKLNSRTLARGYGLIWCQLILCRCMIL